MLFETKKMVTYNDIDANWELSLTAILKYMNEASWLNAEDLGVGLSQIPFTNLAFVTQRISISVVGNPPQLAEEFTLKTWPGEVKRSTFTRRGAFEDKKGNTLIEWESLWVLVDMIDRKIVRPNALGVEVPEYGRLDTTIQTKRIKIPDEIPMRMSYFHDVDFSDLDTYQHMSNTNYGNLVTNVYRRDENQTTFIQKGSKIHFNYNNEAQIFDQVDVKLYQENNDFYIEGKADYLTIFTVEINKEG